MSNNQKSTDTETARLRSHAHYLVDDLLGKRARTRPGADSDSDKRRDLIAFRALRGARELVSLLAGWAINHNLGRSSKGIGFVPLAPIAIGKLPQYAEERAIADDPANEAIGERFFSEIGGLPDDVIAQRRMLVDLLYVNPGAFPEPLARALADALKALEHGEVQPLLAPNKTGKAQPSFSRMHLQLRALEFIEYRYRRGMRKARAIADVANAYGAGENTVRNWEAMLRKQLGYLEVSRGLAFARNAASIAEAAKAGRGEPDEIRHMEAYYGDTALKAAGSEYKRIIRPATT